MASRIDKVAREFVPQDNDPGTPTRTERLDLRIYRFADDWHIEQVIDGLVVEETAQRLTTGAQVVAVIATVLDRMERPTATR